MDTLKKHALTYKPFGNAAILIEWPSEMHDSILKDLLSFYNTIQRNKIAAIVETIQSINSLTIIYDPQLIHFEEMKQWLIALYKKETTENTPVAYYVWKIPVCYDTRFGVDLAEISDKTMISIPKVIELHTKTAYRIYSIGFLPGFLYLGGLDSRLHIDRKPSPRLEVPKGAVGIGGMQTGIYPRTSPGGWQILGNTPISFFDTSTSIPCFAKAGDKIQFTPISYQEYVHMQTQVANEEYFIEKEVFYD